MKRQKPRIRGGSLSLEAAVVLPVVLWLGISLIWLLQDYQAEIKLKGALERVASELSLLSPACDALALLEQSGHASEVDSGVSDSPGGILPALGEMIPAGQIKAFISDVMLDLSSSALLGSFLQYRLSYWLDEACAGQSGWLHWISERRLYLDWRLDRQQLWLYLSYRLQTPLGKIRRQISAVVPLWTGAGSFASVNQDIDQIWLLDNFSRGQKLRQLFGGNLPYDFPVIARFAEGEATSIKSMDLTAPSYQAPGAVLDRISYQVSQLAAFSGAACKRNDQWYEVAAEDIVRRKLLLIIPGNCCQDWLNEVLDEAGRMAAADGIILEIARQGNSARYLQAE